MCRGEFGHPVLLLVVVAGQIAAGPRVVKVPGQAEVGTVEIHGLAAGEFDRVKWEAGALNWVADVRGPMLSPRRSGVFRNIYAPSAVEVDGGWRLFYGAWDGVNSPNDRIYSLFTRDFVDLEDRRIEIEPGKLIHACNVNAIRGREGGFDLVATLYPDARDRNKPAFFRLAEERRGAITAEVGDIIDIKGYPSYDNADVNGMNVLLYEDGAYRLYFGDFKAYTHVQRASSTDGKTWRYDGAVLESRHMANDIRKFEKDGQKCYLMALHANGNRLWYAMSNDGMKFEKEQELAGNLGDGDRYIVAIGWVTKGDRVLGFLYGAGAVPSLDRNRIYARWLQKKVIVADGDGKEHMATGAMGPDRQILSLGGAKEIMGRMRVLAEDGKTVLGEGLSARLVPGEVYRIEWDEQR